MSHELSDNYRKLESGYNFSDENIEDTNFDS